jgi:heme-degrading monooxygenase HmoA
MIARLWRGRAGTPEDADAYQRHVTTRVLPALKDMPGHRGAQVLRRKGEFVVITFWESMDAIRRFAGEDPERAVVEPEARAVLAESDDFVRHYEVME